MTIILACVAYATISYNPMTLNTGTNVPAIYSFGASEEIAATQSCVAYKTVEDATLSAYRKDGLDASLQLYRVNTDSLKVEKIPTPTVRIVVEEQK